MLLNQLYSFNEYQKHLISSKHIIKNFDILEKNLQQSVLKNGPMYLSGFSWTAGKQSSFLLDGLYSNTKKLNFRERLVCKQTLLNNRTRGSIHVFEEFFNANISDKIYLTEQCSLLARWMKKKYKNLYGSEYVDDCSWYYKLRLNLRLFPKKLNHQDLTDLSLDANSFDYVLSFDCLEHIPDFKKALKEIHTILNSGGKFLLSVPFDLNNENNFIRAELKQNGEIKHFIEAEYHGDPVSGRGCLSYYTFGWQLLCDLKDAGFKHSYIILYQSEKYCYLGGEQILIVAEK